VFDYRYHALSLVAVFLALTVGLLLGVAIGDRGLVAGARDLLHADLRTDVEQAGAETRALQEELDRRDRFERQAYPALVAGRLEGRRIGLVFLGARDEAVYEQVRAALAPAGATLAFVTQAEGGREPLGRRTGAALAGGGPVPPDVLAGTAGDLSGADGIVLAGSAEGPFEDGVVEGLRAAVVVGVELAATVPSRTGWYREHGLSSVDNLDNVAGMAALVLLLAGEGSGAYGEKPGAVDVVPAAP
jgi:Copper transport outer membrane protein, MctB